MDTEQNASPGSVVSRRGLIGLAIAVIFLLVANLYFRPNILIAALAVLLGADIAHLVEPRENAIFGGLVGVVSGTLFGVLNLLRSDLLYELSLAILVLAAIVAGLVAGAFYALIAYLAARLLRSYRTKHGFFF